MTGADDQPGSDLDRIQAETGHAETSPDGSLLLDLRTADGEATITVPPINRWKGSARTALFQRDDDQYWAVKTLAPADAAEWLRLDPTLDEMLAFFEEWGRLTGQRLGESSASRPPLNGTRGR